MAARCIGFLVTPRPQPKTSFYKRSPILRARRTRTQAKMSLLNQGRNELRVNNSGAKCLLENWVEERAVSHIDPQKMKDETSVAQTLKNGHRGIVTTRFDSRVDGTTTMKGAYGPPAEPPVREKGLKQELMERAFAEMAAERVLNSFQPPSVQTDYATEFKANYTKEFTNCRPPPTLPHDVTKEQPVTFWTEHRDRVTGVTQVKTRDTVFRKNAAFSTPIGESWDSTQPYEIENHPKM